MKPCKQINIPSVDNSELPCEEYTNSKCVQVIGLSSEIRTYFGLGPTPTLNEVMESIALSLKDARQRIITLED